MSACFILSLRLADRPDFIVHVMNYVVADGKSNCKGAELH
jgi:hypothetical protein